MNVDLSNAKPGDSVKLKNGNVTTIKSINPAYGYAILTEAGHTFKFNGKHMESGSSLDIAEWIPKEAPTPSFLPLQVSGPNGPFYRDREGSKIRIYALDGGGSYPIHGAGQSPSGDWYTVPWTSDGKHERRAGTASVRDIVGLWVDKPEFDWSKAAAWSNYVSMDENGGWWTYKERPTVNDGGWCDIAPDPAWGRVPKEFYPTFSGDWKDSLIERPN